MTYKCFVFGNVAVTHFIIPCDETHPRTWHPSRSKQAVKMICRYSLTQVLYQQKETGTRKRGDSRVLSGIPKELDSREMTEGGWIVPWSGAALRLCVDRRHVAQAAVEAPHLEEDALLWAWRELAPCSSLKLLGQAEAWSGHDKVQYFAKEIIQPTFYHYCNYGSWVVIIVSFVLDDTLNCLFTYVDRRGGGWWKQMQRSESNETKMVCCCVLV